MPGGARWCQVVLGGARWSQVVLVGAKFFQLNKRINAVFSFLLFTLEKG